MDCASLPGCQAPHFLGNCLMRGSGKWGQPKTGRRDNGKRQSRADSQGYINGPARASGPFGPPPWGLCRGCPFAACPLPCAPALRLYRYSVPRKCRLLRPASRLPFVSCARGLLTRAGVAQTLGGQGLESDPWTAVARFNVGRSVCVTEQRGVVSCRIPPCCFYGCTYSHRSISGAVDLGGRPGPGRKRSR